MNLKVLMLQLWWPATESHIIDITQTIIGPNRTKIIEPDLGMKLVTQSLRIARAIHNILRVLYVDKPSTRRKDAMKSFAI